MRTGIFGRNENELEEIDTAGVEIHPTAGAEWIAKVDLDDFDLGFADSEKGDEIRDGRGPSPCQDSALALERQEVVVNMVRQVVFAHERQ